MRSQREHLGDNVAYGDHTKPTSVEVWLADRVPGYRYGVVLALLVITYIVMAAAPPDPWTRVLTVFLQGATLLAAFVVSGGELAALSYCRGRRRPRASDRDWSVVASSSTQPTNVFFLLNILLVVSVPVVIARSLWLRQMSTFTRARAICIYVLLGTMLFAFLYAAIGGFGNSPFFVQTTRTDDRKLPVLQLRHTDHCRLRGLHRRRWSLPNTRGARGADRTAVSRDP